MTTPSASPSTSILGGIAAILSAIAWPLVVSAFLIAYRGSISRILRILARKVSRATHIKAAGVELSENIIEQRIHDVPTAPEKVGVPAAQVAGARKLQEELQSAGIDKSDVALAAKNQIRELALEYSRVRSSMTPGSARTAQLDRIVARMRTLSLLAIPILPTLTRSKEPGERLAAIAALQVQPDARYSQWLLERMSTEQPFIFFHAALALRQLVYKGSGFDKDELEPQVRAALETVMNFTGGPPDQNTIEVLEDTLHNLQLIG
jgi:hypothetical protein